MQERLMDIVSALIANRQPTVLRKPCQRALHNPPMPAQFLRTLHPLSGYAPLDGPFSQSLRALFVVVGFVGMYLIGALPRSASRTLNRLDRVQKLLENHRIVDIGGSADHTERDARPLDHNARRFVPAFPLSVGFAPVLFVPPFSGDTRRVEGGALPIYLLCRSKTIQEDSMQLLPYSSLVPLA